MDLLDRIGLKWLGIIMAVLFWPVEAAMHAFVFAKGTFIGNLFPADADELWMRTIISIAFVGFGLLGHRYVAEHKDFQERIQAKRLRLQQMIDSAYDAYIAIDAHGLIIGWNRSAEKMFGWTVAEALGKPLAELLIPDVHRGSHIRGMKRYMETSVGPWLYKPVVTEARHRDGHELKVELVVTPLRHDGAQEFFAFIRKK